TVVARVPRLDPVRAPPEILLVAKGREELRLREADRGGHDREAVRRLRSDPGDELPRHSAVVRPRAEHVTLLPVRLGRRDEDEGVAAPVDDVVGAGGDRRLLEGRKSKWPAPGLAAVVRVEEEGRALVSILESKGHREVWLVEIQRLSQRD